MKPNNEEEIDESWDPTPKEGEPNIVVIAKGPLLVYGDLIIQNKDGSIVKKSKSVGFCRCGASKNKPFCDGMHKNIPFDD